MEVLKITTSWKEEGRAEGEARGRLEVARRMRAKGLSPEEVFEYTGFRSEDIEPGNGRFESK